MKFKNEYVQRVYDSVAARNPGEPEFLQAVGEVLESLVPVVEKNPAIEKNAILERITEPERAIQFRVTWMDDQGGVHVIAATVCSSTALSAPIRAACACTPR